MNPALQPPQSSVVYCSYLGGNGATVGNAVAADSSGNIYVAGYTFATNFPLTSNTITPAGGGANMHPFITKLNPSASGAAQLVYSSMLRGSGPDQATSIAVDSQGRIAVGGYTKSLNFPVTADAFQPEADR